MTEDGDQEPDVAVDTGTASRHAAFVRDAYAAALDRVPSDDEVAEQSAHLESGLSPQDFLAHLLRCEERQLVLASRAALQARDLTAGDRPVRFVEEAYRAVFGREPDEQGLAHHTARLAAGVSPTDFLAMLSRTDEVKANRAARSQPAFDMHGFVRTTFEAILQRPPEDSAVVFYADALRESMDLEGFAKGLSTSKEGLALRGQPAVAPLNAACVSLMLFLESLLRKRGMVLDLGPAPATDMPAPVAERLLKRLARTIEMMSVRPTPT